MIDIETLGVAYGSTIVSIGAIEFDLSESSNRFRPDRREQFYVVVDRASCEELGLTSDPQTLVWWSEQSAGARQALFQPGVPLDVALSRLRDFVVRPKKTTVVWSYGAEFDFGHLRHCYELLGEPVPWDYRNIMCCRTVASLAYGHRHPPASPGAAHNALHDCVSQVRDLLAAMEYVNHAGGMRWKAVLPAPPPPHTAPPPSRYRLSATSDSSPSP